MKHHEFANFPPVISKDTSQCEVSEVSERDRLYMQLALEEAHRAAEGQDVPVGAVLVADADGMILGRGYNTRELRQTVLGHAELNALEQACAAWGSRRLPPCTLYVTLEPCPMCAGAILQARVGRVVCGTADPVAGAMGSVWALHRHPVRSPHTTVALGCCEDACRDLLQEFFRKKRANETTDEA